MLDLRPIALVNGVLLSILSVAMVVPAIVDVATGHLDWEVFAASATVTLFVGVSLVLMSRAGGAVLSLRQTFAMVTTAWIVIAAFGALPFAFSQLELSFADAFFEAMSGITTTGSTVIVGLDHAPPGILLWRGILQWLGGIGIIVMAVSVLPVLQVGGMQLLKVEAFEADKVLPRAAQIASTIVGVYTAMTAGAALLLWHFGMTGFEAIVHAMTAISTGGFSTSDNSVGNWDVPTIQWTIVGCMILGSMPFVLYIRALRGDFWSLLGDSQVQLMFAIIIFVSLSMTAWVWVNGIESGHDALRQATFNVISVMTGTGYATHDYDTWGGFAISVFLTLMFIGGCAGSTTCGIKIFRFQVLYATAKAQLRRLVQPSGVFIAYYNRKPIPESVAASVMGFFFLFAFCFVFLAVGLGLLGLDFITAWSSAATAISNVGPGLGPIVGPAGTFNPLPDAAKWLLSFGMLCGRLEVYTVLILLTPHFWRG